MQGVQQGAEPEAMFVLPDDVLLRVAIAYISTDANIRALNTGSRALALGMNESPLTKTSSANSLAA